MNKLWHATRTMVYGIVSLTFFVVIYMVFGGLSLIGNFGLVFIGIVGAISRATYAELRRQTGAPWNNIFERFLSQCNLDIRIDFDDRDYVRSIEPGDEGNDVVLTGDDDLIIVQCGEKSMTFRKDMGTWKKISDNMVDVKEVYRRMDKANHE